LSFNYLFLTICCTVLAALMHKTTCLELKGAYSLKRGTTYKKLNIGMLKA
jgi:hypothetical protein